MKKEHNSKVDYWGDPLLSIIPMWTGMEVDPKVGTELIETTWGQEMLDSYHFPNGIDSRIHGGRSRNDLPDGMVSS